MASSYIFEDHHTILHQHNHSVLYKQLIKHSAKWREIGISLGFLPQELQEIQAIPLLLSDAPRSFLSAMLADWLQWAPRDDRGSTCFATLEGLKFALMSTPGLETFANIGIHNYWLISPSTPQTIIILVKPVPPPFSCTINCFGYLLNLNWVVV